MLEGTTIAIIGVDAIFIMLGKIKSWKLSLCKGKGLKLRKGFPPKMELLNCVLKIGILLGTFSYLS